MTENQSETGPCRCGRAPKRHGQRNCLICHAQAQRAYRARRKQRIANQKASEEAGKEEGKDHGQEIET